MMERTTVERPHLSASLAAGADRLGGWAGLAFAATFLVWLVSVLEEPSFVQSGEAARPFLAAHAAGLRGLSFAILIGYLFFLLPSMARVVQRIADARPSEAWLGRAAMAVLAVSLASILLDTLGGLLVVMVGVDAVSDAALAVAWMGGRLVVVWLFHLALGGWVALVGLGILRSEAFPRWMGWLGVACLVPNVVASSWLIGGTMTGVHDAAGGVGIVVPFLVWIPALAVSMLRSAAP